MRRLGTARRAYGSGGLSAVLAALAGRARIDVFHVFATPLDPLPAPLTATVPLTFGWLDASETGAYEVFRNAPSGVNGAARLAAGDRCFVARRDGAIVSSRWIAAGTLREECFPFSFRLGQGEVYEYDTYTDPGSRGLGVAAGAATEVARVLRDEGVDRVIAVVYTANEAGIATQERAGATRTGTLLARGRHAVLLRRGRRPRLSLSR